MDRVYVELLDFDVIFSCEWWLIKGGIIYGRLGMERDSTRAFFKILHFSQPSTILDCRDKITSPYVDQSTHKGFMIWKIGLSLGGALSSIGLPQRELLLIHTKFFALLLTIVKICHLICHLL